MTRKFDELTRPERAEVVRKLIARGRSDLGAARELGTTKNTIVAIRRDFGIAANYRPRFKDVRKSLSGVPLKIAGSEATQCIATDERHLRCAYEKQPSSEYCGLSQHQALTKKHARH